MSVVSLYRYAGAALCSMIENRKKVSLNHPQLKLLYTIQLKETEYDQLPDAIWSLHQGGCVSVLDAICARINAFDQ